jgi:hypothetical protein
MSKVDEVRIIVVAGHERKGEDGIPLFHRSGYAHRVLVATTPGEVGPTPEGLLDEMVAEAMGQNKETT